MQLKYYKMMTPSWLKNKGKDPVKQKDSMVRFGTEVEWNDVEMLIPADTRFNEAILWVPLVEKDVLDRNKAYAVRVVAGLEYDPDETSIGAHVDLMGEIKKNTNAIVKLGERVSSLEVRMSSVERQIAELRAQQAALQAQIAALQAALWRRRDPMCLMISGKLKANGFEIRDPMGYTERGPYRGVEGVPGARGLFDSKYITREGTFNDETSFLTTALAPTLQSKRWPQVYRMNISGDVSADKAWGSMSSDVDGGHSTSINYTGPVDPSQGLRLTLYRGEHNEVYRINYFEVSIYQ